MHVILSRGVRRVGSFARLRHFEPVHAGGGAGEKSAQDPDGHRIDLSFACPLEPSYSNKDTQRGKPFRSNAAATGPYVRRSSATSLQKAPGLAAQRIEWSGPKSRAQPY